MKRLAALLVGLSLTLTSAPEAAKAPVKSTMNMTLTIGGQTFKATLQDNATTRELLPMLPLSLNMTELNGNEKYADLPRALPTSATNPGTIHTGDILLYGAKTIVVFYDTFPTSYRYTTIGRIENPTGLAKALGKGNVSITFDK